MQSEGEIKVLSCHQNNSRGNLKKGGGGVIIVTTKSAFLLLWKELISLPVVFIRGKVKVIFPKRTCGKNKLTACNQSTNTNFQTLDVISQWGHLFQWQLRGHFAYFGEVSSHFLLSTEQEVNVDLPKRDTDGKRKWVFHHPPTPSKLKRKALALVVIYFSPAGTAYKTFGGGPILFHIMWT